MTDVWTCSRLNQDIDLVDLETRPVLYIVTTVMLFWLDVSLDYVFTRIFREFTPVTVGSNLPFRFVIP